MKQKKNIPNFDQSEPEFLISCLDRHSDWAVIVCLVGGWQEINTGEAGISEWIETLKRSYPNWDTYISSRLTDSEYGAAETIKRIESKTIYNDNLHLAVSMRSFRAENVSLLVKQLLDIQIQDAQKTLQELNGKYPIVVTRDLAKTKKWLKAQARGSEQYGIVVSSQAERLKPHAIDVKSPMDPIHWFLDGKENVKKYLKNAHRVLLTRARQGMVIVIPTGDSDDHTRKREYYDPTFEYLRKIGFRVIE